MPVIPRAAAAESTRVRGLDHTDVPLGPWAAAYVAERAEGASAATSTAMTGMLSDALHKLTRNAGVRGDRAACSPAAVPAATVLEPVQHLNAPNLN